ncbi:MAG: exo-alpha-sialidase [Candidatus Latescibacteria bacterium]|nr:exo-alpha-sialidase [Candidatus Latescibacterota bacterium]
MGEELQLIEGFRRLLSAPSGPTHSAGQFRPGIDFRGYAQGWWTLSWWRRAAEDTPPLEWETHPVPTALRTTFSFVGASASTPHNVYPFNRARLLVDGAYALTFDLGVRTGMVWEEGAFRLEFLPRRIQMPSDGYHRQFEMHGNSGLYRLTVPASRVTPGHGLRLRVGLETPREGSVSFFMIKDRQDTLEVSARTNAEQIAQLQEDVTQLRRTLSVLSQRLYPDLYPERLRSREMILYPQERAHCGDLDIALAEDGEVMLAFRLAEEHTAPGGKAVLLRSRAGGDAWRSEEAREVASFPWPSDIRVTVFHRLGGGHWLMSLLVFHHYDRSGERMRAKAGDHETWLVRSADDGKTWTMDSQPLDPGAFPDAAVMAPAVPLPTGRLLMPASSCLSRPASVFLLASDDQGESWRFHAGIGEVPSRYASNYPETTLTRAPSGRLVAMIRVHEGPHLQSFSEDEGMTWTPWEETPMPSFGHRARLITLSGGELLCTYGWRCRRNDGLDDPGGIRVAISRDEGRTWPAQDARILRDDFLNWDTGYPVTLVRRDGRLFTAYWGNQMDRFYIAGNVYERWW